MAADYPEYELAGIETIARGVCVRNGHLLVCRAKGGRTCYLPGGHIEFGETGRAALMREVREELGADSMAGAFLGCLENAFEQHGKPHAEINLIYELDIPSLADAETGELLPPVAQEEWIAFEWRPLSRLDDLLPEAFRVLGENPAARFSC